MHIRHLAIIPLLALAVAGAACSQPEPADKAAPATTPSAASPEAAPVTHDGRAIEVTGDDTIKFSVTELRAKPGERLSVTFANVGSMPKFSMGHNWMLLTLDVEIEKFLVAAAESPTTDYVPASMKDNIIASTKLLGPGERDTVTFAAPTTPGRYEFICSFPGHYQVGMRGVLIVE
jgi:azurin